MYGECYGHGFEISEARSATSQTSPLQEKTYCQTSTVYKMDFEKIGKSYSFSFDLYPKGDAKSEDDIALYIKVSCCLLQFYC